MVRRLIGSRKIAVAVFAVIAFWGGYFLLFRSDFFVVKKVGCLVGGSVSEVDKKRWCQAAERFLIGKEIFLYNQEEIADEVRHLFLPVGKISFRNQYPRRVQVKIDERVPAAKISNAGGRFFLIDKEGVVFSQANREGLPEVVLNVRETISLGSRLDKILVSIILLGEPPVQSVEAVENGFRAETATGLAIFFSSSKEMSGQVRALQAILQKYNIEGKVLRKIDLRFERPVVSY